MIKFMISQGIFAVGSFRVGPADRHPSHAKAEPTSAVQQPQGVAVGVFRMIPV
jgi:hypothetical protein